MDLSKVNFIFCDNPLHHTRPDEDYREEFEVARKRHRCALFSLEELKAGRLALRGEAIQGLTIYRGWMMKPEEYAFFYKELGKKGIELVTTPETYCHYHLLPHWYKDFEDVTAFSVWTEGNDAAAAMRKAEGNDVDAAMRKAEENDVDEAMRLAQGLSGAYIVKDYVKSRKHEWAEACYIPDIQDSEKAKSIILNFVTRQGDELVGGIVLREFVQLRRTGTHPQSGMPLSEEYRIFVLTDNWKASVSRDPSCKIPESPHRTLLIDGYWEERPEFRLSEEERAWVNNLTNRVESPFVSIDLARRADGTLMVMELGDGQVSGLQQMAAERLYAAFE